MGQRQPESGRHLPILPFVLGSAALFEIGAYHLVNSLPATIPAPVDWAIAASLYTVGAIMPVSSTSLSIVDAFHSDAAIQQRMRSARTSRLQSGGDEAKFWISSGIATASAAILGAAAFNQSHISEIAVGAALTAVNLAGSVKRHRLQRSL